MISVLLATMMAGCGDLQTDDAADESAVRGASSSGRSQFRGGKGKPHRRPNHERYRVRNPPSKGREGNATLTMRALIDKDGMTDVEVTTGNFDDGSRPPGRIKSLQVKLMDGAGNQRPVRNFNHLDSGGAARVSFDDLRHDQALAVRALIDGIERRTNVVTVTDRVRFRPDLIVDSIQAPARTTVGAAVNIAAVLREVRGDTGATGSCLLIADGVVVDRATGTWVDAGSAVTCAFTHRFVATGTKQLSIAVSDVVPRDFDPDNNVAQVTMEVVSPAEPFEHFSSAEKRRARMTGRTDGWYQYVPGSPPDWSTRFETDELVQVVNMAGSSTARLTFPLRKVSIVQVNDGGVVGEVTFQDVPPDATADGGVASVALFDPTTSTYFYLETYGAEEPIGTSAGFFRYAGEVTYFSEGYVNVWDGSGGNSGWTWNESTVTSEGAPWPVGSHVGLKLRIEDHASVLLEANAAITMEAVDTTTVYPYTCGHEEGAFGATYVCSDLTESSVGVAGAASGSN